MNRSPHIKLATYMARCEPSAPCDQRGRSELPAPMEFRRGQIVALLGRDYRVARVQG